MKLDTTSYYPKSPLDDDDDYRPGPDSSASPELEKEEIVETVTEVTAAPLPLPDSDDEFVEDTGITGGPDVPPTEGEAFVTYLSNFLSWAFVPLLMPVYGVILAFGLSILKYADFGARVTFSLVVAAFNVLVPAVMVLLLKRFGFVHDVGLNGRRERFVPYLICILCLGATALFMHIKGAPMWLVMFFVGGAVAGAVEVVVNFWWKISVHAAGIAGVVALVLRIMLNGANDITTMVWLMIAIAVAGLLGSARVWLSRHTVWQVFAGYAVGFSAVLFLTMID